MLTYALAGNYQFAETDNDHRFSIPHFLIGPPPLGVEPPIFVEIEYERWNSIFSGCITPIYNAIWAGRREDISYYDALMECGWPDGFNLGNTNATIQWVEWSGYVFDINHIV